VRALVEVGANGSSAAALRTPHPLAELLPGVYRESFIDEQRRTARESFGSRFLAAFDDVLAPVLATLDNLEAYLDPGTTPEDFLTWLGTWVAAPVDQAWGIDRRRDFVARAAELYRRRGTAAGLREHVAIHTGGTVEIIENGASTWSAKADGKLPGSPEPVVVVRVTVDDPSSIDAQRLDALVRASKPAHVVHRVEVIGTGSGGRPGKRTRVAETTGGAGGPASGSSASGGPVSGETTSGGRASGGPVSGGAEAAPSGGDEDVTPTAPPPDAPPAAAEDEGGGSASS
jgi:phage tail-like protein